MRFGHIVASRVRSVFFRGRREAELREELQFHLDREAERLEASGLSREEARLQARRLFGGAEQIKDECRDARGTGMIDDGIRDLRYALRGIRRAPLVSFTIVSTVALGLGLVTVAFTLLSTLLFRVDQVPGVNDMFGIERLRADGERLGFTRDELDALRSGTAIFADAYGFRADVGTRVDGRAVSGTFVTGNFTRVLGVTPAIGRGLTPEDDAAGAEQPVMVLSHRGWERLFARDPAVLGRAAVVNGVTFQVVGVMPGSFRGLNAGPPDDYWAPLSTLALVRPRHRADADRDLDIIGRLKPGMSRDTAAAGLAVWVAARPKGMEDERNPSRSVLVPRRGTVEQPLEAVLVTAPLFFAFGLILLIGCANVANLLLARAVARQRELGIRLSLGATRRRIVRQLLTESLLLALAAAIAGFGLSRLALPLIIDTLVASIPPDIGDIRLAVPEADWRVGLFVIVGAIVATIGFGLVPALQATRIEPLRTIRGEVVRDAKPGRARDVLIGLQVGGSALLLICAAVFLRSALASASVDPGMRISDTVVIPVSDEAARTAILQAVTTDPSVTEVAASWPGLLEEEPRSASAESGAAKAAVAYRFVTPEYFGVLDIPIVRGRGFTPAERTADASLAIVSESTARALWPQADPIGQPMHLNPDGAGEAQEVRGPSLTPRTFTVVGVARDVQGFRIVPARKTVVYVPTTATAPHAALIARVHGDPERARQALTKRLTAIVPDTGQVGTMLWIIRMETWFFQIGFWFTVILGFLALTLTVSGLFSVLSYLVEQRTKEIGVRMALGAGAPHVTRLVLWQSVRPVGLGLLVGGTSAAGLAWLLLATAGADTIGQMVRVLDPVAYGSSMALIVVACLAAASVPAMRAARLDPMRTLRQE